MIGIRQKELIKFDCDVFIGFLIRPTGSDVSHFTWVYTSSVTIQELEKTSLLLFIDDDIRIHPQDIIVMTSQLKSEFYIYTTVHRKETFQCQYEKCQICRFLSATFQLK
jgi:hypothetical protein